jgi:general stress protein YciG
MATIYTEEDQPKPTSARGFASMDAARQREIARKGGRSVPAEKRSFSRDPELAAAAGRKGGNSVPAEQRSFSRNRALAVQAGRKGGIGSRKAKANHQNKESRNESIAGRSSGGDARTTDAN